MQTTASMVIDHRVTDREAWDRGHKRYRALVGETSLDQAERDVVHAWLKRHLRVTTTKHIAPEKWREINGALGRLEVEEREARLRWWAGVEG